VNNNHTLDRLRAGLKLSDAEVVECFTLAGQPLSPEAQAGLHSQAQGAARVALTDALLGSFLDGLIIARRGPSPASKAAPKPAAELTNNMILKKLRIALNLHEEGMLKLFGAGGAVLSKGELTVLFRKPTHKHYKACDDPLLSAFLEGIKKTRSHSKRQG